jgi:flagellar hook-basal body complex protein FliE
MIDRLSPWTKIEGSRAAEALERAAHAEGTSEVPREDFGDLLAGAIQTARREERASTEAAEAFAKGDPKVGLHEVMIAADRASISLRYAVTLKNRAIEAYQTLMNTPL